MKLDPDQQKAVEHFEGPALVVAGPGSGKTTVIKERILNLIQKHNVDPEHILAIAFTNAAADEMGKRFSSEPDLKDNKPKICTLHVFGKDLIKANYKQADLAHAPNNVWDDKKIEEIINREKSRLRRENEEKPVAIYKIEDKTTHQCYIGQTRNPCLRKDQHFNNSSNRRLREAIQLKGKEAFDFTYEWVAGIEADREETYRIDSYRRRAAVNLNKGHKQIDKEYSNILITIYKIESPTTVTCYFGQTRDLESIDKDEGFEIIGEEETWDQASKCMELEIEKHKNWAVFNDEDPLHAQDSTRRRIEVFCEYFDVSYDEVLEHTQKFEHEMRRFDRMNEDIVKVKSHTYTERFKPEDISDPVLRAFAKRYENRKTEAKAIDFLDMLILSANMLEKKENQDLLREYREKHRHVFVDEFQDISPIDFRLIKLFLENLFAVGDDDQAIYGFRGGDSEIMQNFRKGEGVKEYKITRNYRSSSTIVRHAKALINHNSHRISKNLRAENSAQSRVEVLETSRDTVENTLLNELLPIITTCETHFKENTPDLNNSLLQELTAPQKIGFLARNWYEVNPIQTHLNSVLRNKGFQVCWSDSDDQEKRKLIMRRGQKEIEASTIHSAKGREWEKVILLVNTMTYSRKASLPDERNDPEDERRLFYVAVTRAKQELVVFDGGNCRFIPEFQNAPPTKEEWEEAFRVELAARGPKLKIELEDASEAALATFETIRKREVEKASKTARKQHQLDLNHLHRKINEAENEVSEIELAFTKELKAANDEFLKGLMEGLIPVLDAFESQIKNLSGTDESNNVSDDFVAFTESVQLAQTQLLDLLKNHGLKPIETLGEIFNSAHHEEISPAIYSDEVPAKSIAIESQCGYLLPDRVVRKAQVVVSKGREFWTPERLDWIVERYIDRLIFEFRNKYQLSNINRPLVKLKMVQYLTELDGESVGKIDSFAVMNKRPGGHPELYANYCVDPEKTYLCTDTFQDFWNCMWRVVEQSRKNPETEIVLSSKPESFKDDPAEPSTDKPTPMLEIEGEIFDESPKLRGIKPMNKTVEAMPRTNGSPLVPEAQRISLCEPINLIVPESIEEIIDTPPSMSNNFSKMLDTCVKNLKPDTSKIIEVQRDSLHEPINLIIPEPVKEVVDSRLPMPKDCLEIPDSQFQNLAPEILEIEIAPKPLDTVHSNSPLTPQEYEDILKKQIQDLKSDTFESENPDNITQEPTMETEVNRAPVDSTALTRSEPSTVIDSNASQIKEQDIPENQVEDVKKSFGYYLSQSRRFAVEKIKAAIFRKPSS